MNLRFIFFLLVTLPFLTFSQEDENFPPPTVPVVVEGQRPFVCDWSIGIEPEYPGGFVAMKKFIEDNIIFPDSLQWEVVKIFLRFTIEKTGEVGEVRILKSTEDCEPCRVEAVRLIKSMPKWIPGSNNGKPVRSYFDLPITFKNEKKTVKEDEEIFIDPEIPAEFPGGYFAMIDYIRTNLRFPDVQESIEGKVYCRFTITTEGEIKDVKVMRGMNIAECDSEAVRLIRSFPTWTPTRLGDKAIESKYELPIKFSNIDGKELRGPIISNPEQPAEFIGSSHELMKFVMKHFTLPEECIDQSKFYFRFLVSKEGRVTDISLLQSTCRLPGKVRKDMLAKMPIWKPATDKGEKVDSYVTIPMTICFK